MNRNLKDVGKAKTTRRKRNSTVITVAVCTAVLLCTAFGCRRNLPFVESIISDAGLYSDWKNEPDFIRFIDVGEGDAVIIGSKGYTAVIDCGPPENAGELKNKLLSGKIKNVDVLILTHFHFDHIGGIGTLTENITIGNLVIPDPVSTDEDISAVTQARQKIGTSGGEIYIAQQGMEITVGNFHLNVIYYDPDASSENDRSLVIMASCKNRRFLLMGDAESKTEERLIEKSVQLECDVIKIGHHGSNSSSGGKLLNACKPDYAVISCGTGNYYGHPDESVLVRIESFGAKILRTDTCGDIVFYIDDGELYYKTEN